MADRADMGHDDGDKEIIVLTNEDGEESDWTIAGIIPLNGKSYAFLVPVEESANDDGVLMRIDKDPGGDGDILADIEDEEEVEAVAQALLQFLGDEEEQDNPN